MNDKIGDYGIVSSLTGKVLPLQTDTLLLTKVLASVLLRAMQSIAWGVNDYEWLSLIYMMEEIEHKLSISYIGDDAIYFNWEKSKDGS